MKYIFVTLCSFLCTFLSAQNMDVDLLKRINVERNSSLDNTFQIISHSAMPLSVGIPLLGYGIGLINGDSSLKSKSVMIGAGVITAVGVTTILKYSINRKRPFENDSEIIKLSSGGSPSFPSGHTTEAFALATTLSLAHPKWYIIAPVYTWASAVGYSRMHLGVHYPSDVFIGAVIGVGSAFLTHKVQKWYDKKYQKNIFY